MSKLNNQIFEKDFIENNLVKQNNKIMIYSQEQDEKIQKLKEENQEITEISQNFQSHAQKEYEEEKNKYIKLLVIILNAVIRRK